MTTHNKRGIFSLLIFLVLSTLFIAIPKAHSEDDSVVNKVEPGDATQVSSDFLFWLIPFNTPFWPPSPNEIKEAKARALNYGLSTDYDLTQLTCDKIGQWVGMDTHWWCNDPEWDEEVCTSNVAGQEMIMTAYGSIMQNIDHWKKIYQTKGWWANECVVSNFDDYKEAYALALGQANLTGRYCDGLLSEVAVLNEDASTCPGDCDDIVFTPPVHISR